jgi:hypothetical protein
MGSSNGKGTKTTGKGKGSTGKNWKCNDWAMVRQVERYGEIKDANEQIEKLPPIGSKVYVYVRHNYSKTRGERHLSAVYKCPHAYRDARFEPIMFVVSAYSKGIENALDKKNFIRLDRYDKFGKFLYSTNIKAIEVAIGTVDLRPATDEPLVKTESKDNAKAAEYGVKSGKKVEREEKIYMDMREDEDDYDDNIDYYDED